MLGIALLVVALSGLGYGWFASAWDAGTNRITGDRVLIGLSAVLAIGASGMIARQSWGWILCSADAVAVVVIFGLYVMSRTPAPAKTSTLLQQLPGNDASRIAAALGPEWWATSIDELRRREREDNAIARDWEIQGDGRTRLIAPTDLGRGMRRLYLLVNSRKGTIAWEVADFSISPDGEMPAELRLSGDRATVIAHGQRCIAKSFVLDREAGSISPAGEEGC